MESRTADYQYPLIGLIEFFALDHIWTMAEKPYEVSNENFGAGEARRASDYVMRVRGSIRTSSLIRHCQVT